MQAKLLIAGAVAVLAVAAPAGASPVTAAKSRTLTASANGTTVKVKRGDKIVIRLASCTSSCGYSWRTTKKPNASILRRTGATLENGQGGQTQVLRYSARSAGRTSLQLRYFPPGQGRKPEKTFGITVVVR
jgi:predicted secreted protein